MSILGDIIEKLFGEVFFDKMEELAEAFAELGRLAYVDIDKIIPYSTSPIEYARRRDNGNILAEKFRGLSARYRAKLYQLRFIPCCHRACGVMIRKKGRLVRRKR